MPGRGTFHKTFVSLWALGWLPQFNWIGRATTRNYNTATRWWMSAGIEASGFAQINTGRTQMRRLYLTLMMSLHWKKYTPQMLQNINIKQQLFSSIKHTIVVKMLLVQWF
jgi:hypothetical protein